jgi:hypothetical protein
MIEYPIVIGNNCAIFPKKLETMITQQAVKLNSGKLEREVIQEIGTDDLQDKDCKRFSKMQVFGEIILEWRRVGYKS